MKRVWRNALATAVGTALCAAATAQSPRSDDAAPSGDYEESIAFADYLGNDDLRASELLGGRVLDENGEEIGEIEDVVVSRDDNVVTAVVAVGGFLDVGSKLVGVSFDELRISPEGEDFYLAMSAEELQAEPEYQFEERDSELLGNLQDDGAAPPSANGDGQSDVRSSDGRTSARPSTRPQGSATSGAAPSGEDPIIEQSEQRQAVSRSTVVAETPQSADGQVSEQQSSQHGAAQQSESQSAAVGAADEAPTAQERRSGEELESLQSGERRASKLIGAKVVTAEGDEVGQIDDLVVSTADQSLHAVLSVGGLLGVGERLIRVRFDELDLEHSSEAEDEGEAAVRLSMTVDELTSRPVFQYDETQVSTAGPF